MDFPQFSNFPQEIQDMVWTTSVPAHQPTGHPVKLKSTTLPSEEVFRGVVPSSAFFRGVVSFHRRYEINDTDDPPADPEATINAVTTLAAVHRASNAVATRITTAAGTELTRLRASIPSAYNSDATLLPRIRIDIAVDLVVLGPD